MSFTSEDFRSGGVLPSGPVSAWPKNRHDEMMAKTRVQQDSKSKDAEPLKVKVGAREMMGGIVNVVSQGIRHGKVSNQDREERLETCRQCPSFIKESKRCAECGCFMEAKSWIAGNPDMLCPLKKWKI